MIDQHLKYVYEDEDRHENVRRYFWRGKGHKKIRIHEEPGTAEFNERYAELMKGNDVTPAKAAAIITSVKGQTFRWLCCEFFRSAEYQRLHARTQYTSRLDLESCCREPIKKGDPRTFADFPLDRMQLDALEVLRDRKDKLGAADNRVKALRRVFKWGKDKRKIATNPAKELAFVNLGSEGWHSWTVEELEQYERAHPVGSTARLALDLMQYLGLARMDVVIAGPQNIRDETNEKGEPIKMYTYNRGKTGVEGSVAMAEALLDSISKTPMIGTKTFLLNEHGRPFSAQGFSDRFRDWCDAAKLPHCSAHGVRKAAATRAAENGASTHELMAMFAWVTLKEAERYTKAAQRRKLGRRAATFLQKKA
jgi:integrase